LERKRAIGCGLLKHGLWQRPKHNRDFGAPLGVGGSGMRWPALLRGAAGEENQTDLKEYSPAALVGDHRWIAVHIFAIRINSSRRTQPVRRGSVLTCTHSFFWSMC